MKTVLLVLAMLTLGACGEDAQSDPDPVAPSTTAAAATLRDICPKVEAALPDDDYASVPISVFSNDLTELDATGDLEAHNALEYLMDATGELEDGITSGDALTKIEAHQAWLGALDDFAIRCNAVGSSALQ